MTSSPDIRDAARVTHAAVAVSRPDLVEATEEPAPVEESPTSSETLSGASVQNSTEESKGGGFFPLFLGGLVAAGLGFAAAYFLPQQSTDTELPQRVSGLEETLSGMEAKVDGLESSLTELASSIPEADTQTPEAVAALEGQFESVGGELADLKTNIDALDDKIANLAIGGATGEGAPDYAAAFDAQMAEFQAEVDRLTATAEAEAEAARAEADALRAAAEADAAAAAEAAAKAEAQANLRAGLAEVKVALDTGAPFGGALQNLVGIEIPSALTDVASDGVIPLAVLQQTFPEAARAALRVADRTPDETSSAAGKLTSFLMAQTNARSLEPQEGDGADAVLSRAEAALKSGDLPAALDEIANLSDASKAAMSDWLSNATQRAAAVSAVSDLNAAVDAM